MKCSNCGFDNDTGSTSCIVCGTSLISDEKKLIKKNTHQEDTPKEEINSNDSQKTSNIKEDTLNKTHSSFYNSHDSNKQDGNHKENNKKVTNQDKHDTSRQHQGKNIKDNQKNNFQSSMDDIFGEFDKIKSDAKSGESSMDDSSDYVGKTFNGIGNEKIKKSHPPINKTTIFSTRNIAIICILIILLTLAGCIYALHQNDVKHYYNESSTYDPEYHYSINPNEYNQTSYTYNEIHTAHTPQDTKMQMFKESDVNGDGVLKGNEISKMDYKLKHSKYTSHHP